MRRTAIGLLLLLAACSEPEPGGPDLSVPDLAGDAGGPLTVPADEWTWVDFPDAVCDDGSPTGIGVYRSSKSQNLVVYLQGGGACWDENTCITLKTTVRGPFGKAQFDPLIPYFGGNTIFGRNEPTNPVTDWSYVFIPYCTGDLHAGTHVATYGTTTFRHVGRNNLLAFLPRIQATFPSPPKLLVTGVSAGGYGATLNYATFRAAWPQAKGYLLDDSGPLLETASFAPQLYAAWIAAWKMDAILCASCAADWSQSYPTLSSMFAGDRIGLLSSIQDQTIRTYFGLNAAQFQAALQMEATDRFASTGNARVFVTGGQTHTMLFNIPNFTSVGTPLSTWLTQFINDDPAWKSSSP
jgi:hypothetical protein